MTTSFEACLYPFLQKISEKKVLVAFSGGKDSCALLSFIHEFAAGYDVDVSACHVNHMIRGEAADSDALFCKDFCEKRGISFYKETVNVPDYCKRHGLSLEHGARILRYEALEKVLNNTSGDYILTAHTFDDDVETFFMKIIKGSSLLNLSSIPTERGNILRPMLDVSTEFVEAYNAHKGIAPVFDETNQEEVYLRNWIRKKITGEIKSYNKGFFNNVAAMMRESAELKNFFDEKLDNTFDFKSDIYFISLEIYNALSDFERKRILYRILSNCFRVERRHVYECLRIGEKKNSGRIVLPDNWMFEKSYSGIRIYPESKVSDFEILKPVGVTEVYISELDKRVVFKNELINKELLLRNRRVGDRFKGKKVKDLLIDNKIDLFERDRSVIIVYKNKIEWIENICTDNNNVTVY